MSSRLENAEILRFAEELAAMTGESTNEAIRRALAERKDRLLRFMGQHTGGEAVRRYLEIEVWPRIPPELLGRGISQEEQDEILGYGSGGPSNP